MKLQNISNLNNNLKQNHAWPFLTGNYSEKYPFNDIRDGVELIDEWSWNNSATQQLYGVFNKQLKLLTYFKNS